MLVDIQNLTVAYDGQPPVAASMTLSLGVGDRLGLAGESGCGKTTLLKAVVGLLPAGAGVGGIARINGIAGYIPQEGLASLSPFLSAADQVTEFTRSREETARLFARAGLGEERFLGAYPHQLSGGERQRVLAIQALALRPAAIIADEPSANLDPENEAAVLSMMDEYARETGAAILIASHRDRVFQALNCRVYRMTPEALPAATAVRSMNTPRRPLISVRNLSKCYFRRDWLTRSRPVVQALHKVSIEVGAGECVAVAGRSGAGKSTLARCIAGREPADSGAIEWHDAERGQERVQLVQQEPSQSLNPRMTVAAALREACREASPDWLARVRLPHEWFDRRVSALSEGQRARVAILRSAERLKNGLLILDESLSGLDAGTRSHIISYLSEMRQERGLGVLLITHDSEAASKLGARMVRMEAGQVGRHRINTLTE